MAGAVAALCLLFVPSFVAAHYARGPGGVEGAAWRPDKGWRFLVDAVSHSRGAQLGSSQSASERARDVWAGARLRGRRAGGDLGVTARATDVELVWTDGPFRVPGPAGQAAPAPGNDVARPRGPFAWVVYGHLARGPRQMIGMLDYDTGVAEWDIRDGVFAP